MKTLFRGQDLSIVLDDDTKTYTKYDVFLPNSVLFTCDIRVVLSDEEIINIINIIKKEYRRVK